MHEDFSYEPLLEALVHATTLLPPRANCSVLGVVEKIYSRQGENRPCRSSSFDALPQSITEMGGVALLLSVANGYFCWYLNYDVILSRLRSDSIRSAT